MVYRLGGIVYQTITFLFPAEMKFGNMLHRNSCKRSKRQESLKYRYLKALWLRLLFFDTPQK